MNSANAQYENRWAAILGQDLSEESTQITCNCYNNCNKDNTDDRCTNSTDHNLKYPNDNQLSTLGSRYK